MAEELIRIAQARTRLEQAIENRLRREQERLDALRTRPVMTDPTATFVVGHEQLQHLRERGLRALTGRLEHERTGVAHQLARVRAMSPKATLERGYSILVGPEGHAITSVTDVDEGDDLLAYLLDGQLVLEARDVRPGTLGAT